MIPPLDKGSSTWFFLATHLTGRATSSSNALLGQGATFVMNGKLSLDHKKIVESEVEVHAWLQVEFTERKMVTRVIMTNRKDCCFAYMSNIAIHIGDEPAVVGQLSENPVCTTFSGTSGSNWEHDFECNDLFTGMYLIVQKTVTSATRLSFNEIVIYGFPAGTIRSFYYGHVRTPP